MKTLTIAMALLASCGAHAQHAHDHAVHHTHAQTSTASPYAGMQDRTIKALSAQQMADLRAGKGMSLALPAELNGYPGPSHVLELADRLGLSDAQRAATERLFDEMKKEAGALGERLIASEAALDRLFRERRATASSVDDAASNIAHIQGALRAAHLRYHLHMMEVLEPGQVAEYAKLRGYR
ncbi:MAG TPA: hypothetical protein VEC06_07265 [Paucimonas sp.]|nr:hypothetical protein [Paucimonas sp.]